MRSDSSRGARWRTAVAGPAFAAALLAAAVLVAGPAAAQEPPKELNVAAGTLKVEKVAGPLGFPWSLVFLPDGRMLVSEKQPGQLRIVTPEGEISKPLAGLPPVFAEGNGGLLGLALDPKFADNHRLYFAYAEPGEGKTAGLTVARAVLGGDRITETKVLFRQKPKIDDIRNFGGRLAFGSDGTLFVGTGDRFAQDLVQDRSTTIGRLVRIAPDGSVPKDNPFVGEKDTDPTIWSLGHRNLEGLAVDPLTGTLWTNELGPWGGDELNIPLPGRNYGWPLVSWGRHYDGQSIPDPTTRPDLARSIYHWNPVISPSGMSFYDGRNITDWTGNLLIGGLSSTDLVRLTLEGERVISEEKIDMGVRVRDVAEGPDGAVYFLSDQPDGGIYRITMETPAGQ